MKKRAYLAVLALCVALTGSACGTESQTSGNASSDEENTETVEKEDAEEPEGFGTRLVSVENVEKYIAIAEYKGLVLDRNIYEVTDEQIEEQIKYNLQSDKAEVTDAAESVKEGDSVTINYVGQSSGKVIEVEDTYDLTVGEGSMTAGFEDGLIGMKKGETKTIQITFPEDFYSEELAGAVGTYRVTLQAFQRTPELTDALVAANTDVKTLEEYRAQIREQMEANAEIAAQDALKSAAWEIVLTNSEVREYPQADIDNAIEEFKKQVMLYNNESDMDLELFVESQGMTMEAFNDQCQQYAESKVKQNLIIQGIMDAEGITLEDEECLMIQDQLVKDFQAASLAQLLDTYGQTMIDEAIGLLRIEDFLVENAAFEEEATEEEALSEEETDEDAYEEDGSEESEEQEA